MSPRINEILPAPGKDQAISLLRDVAGEAFDFLEHYCNCRGAKGLVAKKLRRAMIATEAYAPPVDQDQSKK